VTTAGHCDGINQIVQPGGGVWALNFVGEHCGQWGDVEWSTSNQIEPAQFYSDANNIRIVTAVEARGDIRCDGDIDTADTLGILRYVAWRPPLASEPGCRPVGT